MKIITIPHPSLRQTAQPITTVDENFLRFLQNMKTTLMETTQPKGVGLAAPQVDVLYRVFLTLVDDENPDAIPQEFINPVITKHSAEHTFGPDPENPRLEGCLSMPGLYGPVPRWEWVEVEYQATQGLELVGKKDRFSGFHARVVQHEIDHLDGILFTDHSLHYDLPVYVEKKKELVEITDRQALELF